MSKFLPKLPRVTSLKRRTFAIVASRYNQKFVKGLVDSTRRELALLARDSRIVAYEVPGAFEIPVMLQEVASRGGVDAIVALGVIIEGETAHADLIGRCVTGALQEIAMRFRIPVIHEVLLVKDEEQARARTLGKEPNRGTEAARAAVEMAEALAGLKCS